MKYTVADGFPYYIALVGNQDYRQLFRSKETIQALGSISEEKASYRYAPGKWSIKQIIGHITDHERIMTYRALRFSRKDKTPLPGYDQNLFVDNSTFDQQSLTQLLNEFEHVRNASISLMDSLSPEQRLLTGTAWKYELTVEEFLKATVGHEIHHLDILRQKYSV
jgi:uncharacterized damage-inducible protein DinB